MTRREMRCGVCVRGRLSERKIEDKNTHGSEDSVHELVQLRGIHESVTFKDAHCQFGDHWEMRLQHGADGLAEAVIVLCGFNLLDLAEGIEGCVVQVVDLIDVRVGHDNIGQALHIADAVGDPGATGQNKAIAMEDIYMLWKPALLATQCGHSWPMLSASAPSGTGQTP